MTGRQFLYIIIATFITVIIWVLLDIQHNRNQVSPEPEVQQLIKPLNPNFDLGVLDEIGD
ncbi:MAG: hypothetical protein C4584_00705 [Armatimonadetes bacterium]|nr:MAG: hypothetical protein C4584_00705 [Armatimonadota bacterium]